MALFVVAMPMAFANPEAAPPAATPPKPPLAVAPEKPKFPETVSTTEAKSLIRELDRAQKSALMAMDHRHKLELDELDFAQKVRRQEWEAREREEKHKFFGANTDASRRKAHMEQFKQKREGFERVLKDEREMRVKEFEEKKRFLGEKHAQNRQVFETYLNEGKRPPEHLWP